MAGRGRPQVEIDPATVEKLSGLGCTDEEMAGWFGVSVDTWTRRKKQPIFAEAIKKGQGRALISLRRRQQEIALSGNVAMLIWLGKQRLGQTDKIENRNENIGAQVAFYIPENRRDNTSGESGEQHEREAGGQ